MTSKLRVSTRITVSPFGALPSSACPTDVRAEVARHPDVDVAGDLVARAEAAAAGEDGEEADDGEPPHDTATSRGNASTIPACVAVSRTRPVAAGTVSVAVPSAAVVAVADPSATVAPATFTPRPLSS